MKTFVKEAITKAVIGIVIGGAGVFCVLKVQAIGDERYVRKEQLSEYIKNHKELGDEVRKEFQDQHQQVMDELHDLKNEVNQLRQELLRRPPFPPRVNDRQEPVQ